MKFADKIIYSCLLVIVAVYTLGSTIMIFQNHQHLLETVIQQNIASHKIETYSLESKLIQDMKSSQETNQKIAEIINRASYYLQQFNLTVDQPLVTYALLNIDNEFVYTKIDPALNEVILANKAKNYILINSHLQNYMIISSQIKIEGEEYTFSSCYNMTSTYQERNRQFTSSLYIGGFVLILSYFILKSLSRYLTASILKLNKASQIIASGNYSERTHITSHDEIGELSQSFNEMAEMNEKTIEKLQLTIQQKEEFMANFSHEIKTPMTAILGFADMMRTYVCSSEDTQKAAQYIYTEGKRLETLSHALMDLLALDKQNITFAPTSFSSVIKQLETYYQGKDLNIELVFKYEEKCLNSQVDLLFIMMRNLIDNALKASSPHSQVIICGEVQKERYCISITDHGIGMSEEDIEKVTEPFYMADKSRARSQGGAGLGLALVKRICVAHQTKLTIHSQLSIGTTVYFDIEVYQDE